MSRINLSLDTFKPDRFRYITRLGRLKDVLAGISAAKKAGFDPVKINVVVIQGINDDEILDFAKMTYEEGSHVRFIELMPFKGMAEFVPSIEVRQRIGLLGKLEPTMPAGGNGPAVSYRLAGAKGTIGFISPLTENSFCSRCNRIRLTADGRLRPCLLGEDEIDLRTPLRNNVPVAELERLMLQAVASKRERHHLEGSNVTVMKRKMSQIGG